MTIYANIRPWSGLKAVLDAKYFVQCIMYGRLRESTTKSVTMWTVSSVHFPHSWFSFLLLLISSTGDGHERRILKHIWWQLNGMPYTHSHGDQQSTRTALWRRDLNTRWLCCVTPPPLVLPSFLCVLVSFFFMYEYCRSSLRSWFFLLGYLLFVCILIFHSISSFYFNSVFSPNYEQLNSDWD
jgi:hypothetical protein